MTLDYKLKEIDRSTQVDIDVDLTLSGPIAQFGRVGLVTEVANVLIGEFTSNLDAKLSQSTEPSPTNAAPQQKQLSAWSILVAVFRKRLKMLFSGAQS